MKIKCFVAKSFFFSRNFIVAKKSQKLSKRKLFFSGEITKFSYALAGMMFYYHNPLSFAGGATRLPSLELPFSPAQPCKPFFNWNTLKM